MNKGFYYTKKNNLITGRGSTAIYLVFINEGIKNFDVLVPGNICYAAVYPVIASGNNPVFCDVDACSGNITPEILDSYKTEKTKAVIVPHMYGNHVNELDEISEWCKQNKVLLIEDCASSLGSKDKNNIITGSTGDYVIYSFGHSKIMDLGDGGLLSSNRDLEKAERALNTLPLQNNEISLLQKRFSDEYRVARYQTGNYKRIRELMCDDIFLYRINDSEICFKIKDDGLIDEAVNKHINNYSIYDSILNRNLQRYHYNEGSVPWRFSLLLDEEIKRRIIHCLLDKQLPVSDWYPNITEMFMDHKIDLAGVDDMEKSIINFPLDIEEETIRKICFNIDVVTEGLI
ncbi:MAG: DegT/DnrJ/EryC1/StrS family aminotransferase [Methanobrevibacter sp.]|nr:DegT/DnrJ/EryC1/StrS family aminotransferase [Methanobrevibacter sp.]